MFILSRASREYLHVRYPLVYIRFIFVPRIHTWEFIREALCRLIHFTLSGTCICVYTYEYKTRYCFVRNPHITMRYAIAQCIPALILLIRINNAHLQMS